MLWQNKLERFGRDMITDMMTESYQRDRQNIEVILVVLVFFWRLLSIYIYQTSEYDTLDDVIRAGMWLNVRS